MTHRRLPVRTLSPVEGTSAKSASGFTVQPDTHSSFLADLHCPYCGFQLEQTADLGRGRDAYGILACACHQYPIVEGIPILQQIDGLDRVVELIKGDEPRRALIQALRVFRIRWAHRSRWHRALYYLNCRRLVSDAAVTFEDAAQLVRTPKAFADYLIHRYANPSFLAAIGPLMLLEHLGLEPEEITCASGSRFVPPARRTPRVLDLACGAGHASFLMALLHPGLSVVSADQDFVSLYLAKRFVAPEATHVCWDVEAPSPFPEDYFDAVFCLDAFHYFKSKRAVVSELKRIATADALWLFPHLHNGRQHNLVAGIPLSPEKYLECFALAEGRLFDETEILHGLSQQRVVDLRSQPPSSQLNQARTLTFVRGGRAVWRAYNRFPLAFCADTSLLTVNPIYRGLWQGDILELRLTWPNDSIRRECSSVTAVLRSTYQLNKADLRYLRDLGTTPDWDHLGDLIAKFVLVPLPRRYQRVDLTALGDVSRRVASVN